MVLGITLGDRLRKNTDMLLRHVRLDERESRKLSLEVNAAVR